MNITKSNLVKENTTSPRFNVMNSTRLPSESKNSLNQINFNKMLTKTNFHPLNGMNKDKDIYMNSYITGKHERKHSYNQEKIRLSVSPIKNVLPENKSLSPIKDPYNFTKKKLFAPESHRLTSKSPGIEEAYNTKEKNFLLKSSSNNASNNNPNMMNININFNMNMNLNNYFNNNDTSLLPNLKLKSTNVNKTDELTNLINEKISKFDQTLNSQRTNNPSSTINSSLTLKKDFLQNISTDNKKEKENRELTPNNSRKFILIKDSSDKNLISSINKKRKLSQNNISSSNREIIIHNEDYEGSSKMNISNNIVTTKKPLMINKHGIKTKPGMTSDGNYKTNQDSFLTKTKIFNLENYSVFGVFDGHGTHGHFVSNYIKLFFADYFSRTDLFLGKEKMNNLMISTMKKSSLLNNQLNMNKSTHTYPPQITEESVYDKLREKNYYLIKNSFFLAESALSQSKYEVNFSGATSVVVIIIDDKIICANAGDSRAILVVESKDCDEGRIIPLSRDHKPELKDESQRVIKSGGRVERYNENGVKSGPFRVWLKNENFPGLAMSRSVGDFVAESVGVICEPGKYIFNILFI
jgi:serine/threonine protein phosphatase PrpC